MEPAKATKNPAKWVEKMLKDFINTSPENKLQDGESERAWADPLVGFSSGDDPLYEEYKAMIGAFYWTPSEIFGKTFPALNVEAGQLTVISWILPQMEATKSDNRKQTRYPSERWVRSRIQGEEVNEKLRKHVVATLQDSGFEGVAPMLSPFWERQVSERYGVASNWSERHAAYTSGLGTFGLCDGLITSKGKAMRCGSVVANIKISPTKRPYQNHHEYCLYFTQGICGKCIKRCPAGAVTKDGHDKDRCYTYMHEEAARYMKAQCGFQEPRGCGLCQTAVPCESKIPTRRDADESKKHTL